MSGDDGAHGSNTTRSRVFDALGWAFAVSSEDARVVDHVSEMYAGLPDPPAALVHEYVVDAIDDATHELAIDGERLGVDEASKLMHRLVHDVNRRAIDASSLLTAHAGGVVGSDGRAIVLPAHMEAGKTTLTAGLVCAGLDYLSDEAVAFDFDTLDIVPYAKPLSIDPGSWPLFPQLEPDSPFERDGSESEQWLVPPQTIRAGCVARTARARHVVFPRYRAGATTVLEPIGRADGVVELARNTFHFRRHGRRGLDALARLVTEVECYRLELGDLDEGVAAVAALAGTGP